MRVPARRALLLVVVVPLTLAAVMLWRAGTLPSRQPPVEPAPVVTIDEAAVAFRLAAALEHPTVSHMEADRRDDAAFVAFRSLLAAHFPRLHEALTLELVGGHSLLYHWPGSDPALAPALLMGHYDVVPVEPGTEADWTHPPFAGVVADDYIWGRGALDNKSGVLAILEAVEGLLQQGFVPQRGLLLAFGHDEEIGGRDGAAAIAQRLAERGIRLAWVLDEGGVIVRDNPLLDAPLALVGTAEKGYLSIRLAVRSRGGHSSQPPPETAAGIVAGAVHRIQQHRFRPAQVAPTRDMFRFAAPELGFVERLVFANDWLLRPLIVRQLAADPSTDAMIRTTVAPTMLRGSDKDNVLPIVAEAVVNFRILPGESVAEVLAVVKRVVGDPRVELVVLGEASEPSPVSPADAPAFELLARTIREIRPDVLVVPYLVLGATDARHYTALSPHVYRFLPFDVTMDELAGMHGTDERLRVAAYADGIRFYRRLLENALR